jgi:hypothetical protein
MSTPVVLVTRSRGFRVTDSVGHCGAFYCGTMYLTPDTGRTRRKRLVDSSLRTEGQSVAECDANASWFKAVVGMLGMSRR